MKSINEDLKTGSFRTMYLLYGEEAYLKRTYKEKLLKALTEPGDTMNFASYEGKGINVQQVIDLAETLPFFADRRVILMEDTGLFKSGGTEFAEYLKEAPETTTFIFSESEVDKRSRLYKVVKEKGRAAELGRQDEKTIEKWILGILSREGKKITRSTMDRLLTMTGVDMENIEKELEKLNCYTLGRDVITSEDVEAVCTVRTTNRIFDMVEAVAAKNQKRALELYYDLLALKEPPMRILFLLARQFNLLLQVKSMQKKGLGKSEIAKNAGLHPFIAGKYMGQTGRFSASALKGAVEDCVRAEEDVKTGRMNDVMSVELFIVKYSSP